MLSFVASIDWKEALPGLFLTITYPTKIEIQRRNQLNIHRQVFWRSLEKYLCQSVPALWRVEWKPRLTGTKKGYVYPHYHFLIFQQEFIPVEDLREMWKKTIGYTGKPVIWIEPINNGKKAGVYTAKYAAKDSCSLDNVAYHNSIPLGRNWGMLRKSLIPRCKATRFRAENGEKIKEIRDIVAGTRKDGVLLDNESFTLLGPFGKKIIEFLEGMGLEGEEISD